MATSHPWKYQFKWIKLNESNVKLKIDESISSLKIFSLLVQRLSCPFYECGPEGPAWPADRVAERGGTRRSRQLRDMRLRCGRNISDVWKALKEIPPRSDSNHFLFVHFNDIFSWRDFSANEIFIGIILEFKKNCFSFISEFLEFLNLFENLEIIF